MNTPASEPHLPLIHSCLDKWSGENPDKTALIQHETGWAVSYRELNEMVDLFALGLLKLGVVKGERVAVMGLQSVQYIALQYACFKIGAVLSPLDIKLKPQEVVRELRQITPALFILHAPSAQNDFYEAGRAVLAACPFVRHVLYYYLNGDTAWPEGAQDANRFLAWDSLDELAADAELVRRRDAAYAGIKESDPALIIFTTGTTGEPKPAVLQHQCIVAQMRIFLRASVMPWAELRRVCILPCSHVGGTTITVYSTLTGGGTNIVLHRFNPAAALQAIEKWQGNWIGAVPTMFRMMWALPDYGRYNLGSLQCAYYAGSMVDLNFLQQLAAMAPNFGTSLGMTECGGVSTYTPMPVTIEALCGQVGRAAEDIAEISIRKPMTEDGWAGEELPLGEMGEICYHPPLVFLGYFNQPEATAKTVSREGILYSGDIGFFKEMGSYKGLFFMGRSKFMIKQKGYNVFPDEVASHISQLPGVAEAEVIGVKHHLYDEGVFAFVLPQPGWKVEAGAVMAHCRSLAAYKRPQYVKVLEEQGFPLNNNGKVDKNVLLQKAEIIVAELRKQGLWDSA